MLDGARLAGLRHVGHLPKCGCATSSAVVLLRQAKKNAVRRLSRGEAFLRLHGQVTVNRWDQAESARVVSDAVEALLRRVPAFLLDCTISEEAVDCLYEALYPATVAETVRLRACL